MDIIFTCKKMIIYDQQKWNLVYSNDMPDVNTNILITLKSSSIWKNMNVLKFSFTFATIQHNTIYHLFEHLSYICQFFQKFVSHEFVS